MEKDALIVNLFGGPGVGKSTTAAGMFSLLKLHDVDCEIITEYAKDLVWEERSKTFKDQQYLFAKQHHRIWRVRDKVDIVITDCPLMLSPMYGERYGTGSPEFDANVVSVVQGFKNCNIVLQRTKKYNQNGRNENEDQARDVDRAIRHTLEKNNMTWKEVPGNFEGLNQATEYLLKRLKVEPKFKFVMGE